MSYLLPPFLPKGLLLTLMACSMTTEQTPSCVTNLFDTVLISGRQPQKWLMISTGRCIRYYPIQEAISVVIRNWSRIGVFRVPIEITSYFLWLIEHTQIWNPLQGCDYLLNRKKSGFLEYCRTSGNYNSINDRQEWLVRW